MVVAPTRSPATALSGDLEREPVEPDAIKVNDDGWRIHIYKHLADEMHAFALTDRIGFASFENGALAYAELFHIKRRD